MKKPITFTTALAVMLALPILFCPQPAQAEIVVRQDQNGDLYITNIETDWLGKKNNKKPSPPPKRINPSSSSPSSSSDYTIPAQYLAKIRQLAKKYQVQESLIISVARAESSFNPHAVSHKGAVGIMQLMKDTAIQYGVNNRYNADENLEAGVRHLKYLYEKYNHNLSLTLAAYNAGEEAVKKYNGVPPYSETRDYIKRVMRYMGMNYTEYSQSTTIYQYRTKDGSLMITDSYPTNAVGEITIIK